MCQHYKVVHVVVVCSPSKTPEVVLRCGVPSWTNPVELQLISNGQLLNVRKVALGYHKVMEESAIVNTYLRVESKPRRCAMINMRKVAPSHNQVMEQGDMMITNQMGECMEVIPAVRSLESDV